MKKIILILSCIVLASSVLFATVQPNVSRTASSFAPMVGDENKYDLGTSTEPWRTIYSSGIVGGIVTAYNWFDIPTADTDTVYCQIMSTTVALSTTTTVNITNPTFPRNIIAQMSFNVNVADVSVLSVTSITLTGGKLTIVGVNQLGETVSESMNLMTNSCVGTPPAGISYSTNCYASITSLTVSATRFSGATTPNVFLVVGTGNRIGLPGYINYSSDIIKVIEAGSISTTYTVGVNGDWIDFASDPNASSDYTVWFKNRNIEK